MYFADPYCAWQKGTNENLNGLLREFYPKGHNLSRVSPKTLEKNLALINARSKKILNFQKPQDLFELFLKKCCTWFDNSPKTVFISFLRQVEVWPLRDINFGIDYDAGNSLNTKITEPRVQTRLCLAEAEGFEPPWRCRQTVFKTASLWPLRYASVDIYLMGRKNAEESALTICG